MSDHDDDFDDTEQQPGWRKKLESRATTAETKAAEAQKRAEAAERRLSFAEAGVNLADPKAKWLLAGFDGDPADKAAVLAAATELGLNVSGAPTAETQDVVTPAEKAALHEIDRASNGGTAPGRAEDLETRMRSLAGRKDLTPAQARAELDALVAEAGIPMQA